MVLIIFVMSTIFSGTILLLIELVGNLRLVILCYYTIFHATS